MTSRRFGAPPPRRSGRRKDDRTNLPWSLHHGDWSAARPARRLPRSRYNNSRPPRLPCAPRHLIRIASMKWYLTALLVLFASPALLPAAPLELKKGDHICLIGNTLPDRMQHFGWLETNLHARHPQHEF